MESLQRLAASEDITARLVELARNSGTGDRSFYDKSGEGVQSGWKWLGGVEDREIGQQSFEIAEEEVNSLKERKEEQERLADFAGRELA